MYDWYCTLFIFFKHGSKNFFSVVRNFKFNGIAFTKQIVHKESNRDSTKQTQRSIQCTMNKSKQTWYYPKCALFVASVKWSFDSLKISANERNSITPYTSYTKKWTLPAAKPSAADKNDLFANLTSRLKYTTSPPRAVVSPASKVIEIAVQD